MPDHIARLMEVEIEGPKVKCGEKHLTLSTP